MTVDDRRLLRGATVAFAAGFLVHNADHMRRGFAVVTDEVILGGTVIAMLAAVVATLVAVDHPLAPEATVAVGFAVAVGVSASHLVPEWSALSDALPGGDVDVLTWVAVLAEVVGALVLGLAGLVVIRRRDAAQDEAAASAA